jgi:hypothetical protein
LYLKAGEQKRTSLELGGAVDIVSASEAKDLGSNPARLCKRFLGKSYVAILLCTID